MFLKCNILLTGTASDQTLRYTRNAFGNDWDKVTECVCVWCCIPRFYSRDSVFTCFQDGQAMLWDLNEGKHLYTLEAGDAISSLVFSPNRYWLCAASGSAIKIWVSTDYRQNFSWVLQVNLEPCLFSQDLEGKTVVDTLTFTNLAQAGTTSGKQSAQAQCLSLAWSADGQTLFAGYSDNRIRVWQVTESR